MFDVCDSGCCVYFEVRVFIAQQRGVGHAGAGCGLQSELVR